MKSLLILIAFLTSFVGAARADDFSRGNDFYAAGKFTEAAASYEAQIKGGACSANLFYNLANTDFRLGERGKALLNYRRALVLEPTHAEAAANLGFVRGSAGMPAAPAVDVAIWSWTAAAALWICLVALVVGFTSTRRRVIAWSIGALSAFVAAGCIAALAFWTDDASVKAIILRDKTSAFYAPADTSPVVTALSAGSEIKVLADRGAWLYAQLPNGARAWLAAPGIERLVPAKG